MRFDFIAYQKEAFEKKKRDLFFFFSFASQPNNLIINLENDDEWILKDDTTLAGAGLGVDLNMDDFFSFPFIFFSLLL